jgi:hypothetical protein
MIEQQIRTVILKPEDLTTADMDGGLDRLIDHKEFNNHLNFLTVIII